MAKITKIEEGKRNKNRVNVFIDHSFAFAMDLELAYKTGIKVNDEIDEEKLREIAKKEGLSKCKESAIRVVERSYKTKKEIREKLKEKEFTEEEIDYAIEFLINYNFLNDEKYTRMYIKDKLYNQGKNKIRFALERKGIDKELIEEIFLEFDNNEELERGIVLGEKKYNTLVKRESDIYKLKNKLLRYLVGRGYDFSIAKDIMNRVLDSEKE